MAMPTETDLEDLLYPDSDGKPMADNTLQFRWIVTIHTNLDGMYRDDPNVFVAGDLLWYAVHGDPSACVAPDVLVVFGRPQGYRGSYRQWRENGIAPQVVFEVMSPNNMEEEMERKLAFYDRHGVEEYYLYDPDGVELSGWVRVAGQLQPINRIDGWVSPRLRIRFDLSRPELVIYHPDGTPFETARELVVHREQERRQRHQAERLVEQERIQREEAQGQVEQERQQRQQAEKEAATARKHAEQANQATTAANERAERLAAKLRELGIDPDA